MRNFKIKLEQDFDPMPPDDMGDDAILLVTTRNRHFEKHRDVDTGVSAYKRLTAEDFQDDEVREEVESKYHLFPLFAYIHSGIALSTGPFSCPWDSGQIGFVLVSRKEWKSLDKATEIADSHVEVWNQYLSGDVWGYVIEDEQGEHVDSCWGFYGEEYCREEAEEMVRHLEEAEALAEAEEKRVCAL